MIGQNNVCLLQFINKYIVYFPWKIFERKYVENHELTSLPSHKFGPAES